MFAVHVCKTSCSGSFEWLRIFFIIFYLLYVNGKYFTDIFEINTLQWVLNVGLS